MKRLSIICAVLLILPCIALSTPVPDTGQTACYNNSGEITCPLPGASFYGQDGQYGPNMQSYTKLDENGNDLPDGAASWIMVRDNVTGLIWQKDTAGSYTFQQALSYCENLTLGGYSDWRIPTVKELSFIVDRTRDNPTINISYFPDTVVSNYYWSSTSYADPYFPPFAWLVHFSSGYTNNSGNKLHSFYLRAVRGEEISNSFVDNLDGTVTDTNTGLMWQQDTAPGTYTWQEALSYCENLELAGHDDWRLPNINELQSLLDYTRFNPSIDPVFLNTVPSSGYWSSTTYATSPNSASYILFYDGLMYPSGGKSGPCYVRAVREGCIDDYDCDEIQNANDNCPDNYNQGQEDGDGDTVGDACDNCSLVSNSIQEDTDGDTIGNACDNCSNVPNQTQEDTDADGMGDACDYCPHDPENDIDSDGVCGDIDNCVSKPNSPSQGICTYGVLGEPCSFPGFNPMECGDSGYCSMNQEDTSPPQGNGIGDACDCEGNFNCDADSDVDGSDAFTFKTDFGRNPMGDPCTNEAPCHGDFNCDHDCDGTDAARFKQDFGRSAFSNPCPLCTMGVWCAYE